MYGRSSKTGPVKNGKVEKRHRPAMVMVWWGIAYDGVTQLDFSEQRPKTYASNYQTVILEKLVKPLHSLFAGKHWVFHQDCAPAHMAKSTQRWLEANLPEFTATEDWPSGSPDHNPLDYRLWNTLEKKACSKPHRNIEALKADLVKAATLASLEVVRAAIDEWLHRLKQCMKAKGGLFE
ncbi:hypothetical protein Trydic_g16553 [Trypoxylus dichotomus]